MYLLLQIPCEGESDRGEIQWKRLREWLRDEQQVCGSAETAYFPNPTLRLPEVVDSTLPADIIRAFFPNVI